MSDIKEEDLKKVNGGSWFISEEDGKPKFSVPERTDQNKLFSDQIKAAYAAKKGK